ncbi:MAG: type II secretion system F family protein [Candidatus Zapsychrus exili]|nr:type II secretion system F family protein [Candidatus Zapsychrus exili]
MPNYNYKARDENGKLVQASLGAASEEELVNQLRKMGYMPVEIFKSELKETVVVEAGFFSRFKRVTAEDMIIFNMQLASMVNAGITLLNSLNIITKQIENKHFADIVNKLAHAIASGSSFSEALLMHKGVFSDLYINLVRAGEIGGNLDKVLVSLANYIEEQEELKQKIKGALMYPAVLMIVGLLVVFIIVTFVLPKFIDIFNKAGVPLPVVTQIVYSFGMSIKQFWYLFILGGYLSFLGLKVYISTQNGGVLLDRIKLRIPIIGTIIRKSLISRFARTLSTLIASGVSMLKSLDIVKDVVGNEVFAKAIYNAKKSVERGERLDQPLRASGEFPADVIQMITAGEETGKLSHMLNKIADFYDMSLRYAIRKLTVLIEPVFIVIMGAVVGVIMAAMILPLFDMVKTISR